MHYLYYKQQNMLSRSNLTSISFTVQDDLISESSLNSTQKTAFHGLKPFAKKFGLDSQPFDDRPLNNKNSRDIIERAQADAYRQMNENLYNPFQHKLGNGFVLKQSDLYQQQKQRQIQLLRKKEQQMMRSNNSYTIVFNNEKKSKHNLQMAGRNIVGEPEGYNIADYYNKKFKKPMDNIEQQENDQNQNEKDNQNKKVNNFVSSSKKNQKSIQPVTHQQKKVPIPKKQTKQKQKQKQKQKIESNTAKRKSQEVTSIKTISGQSNKKQQLEHKKQQKKVQSVELLKNTLNTNNAIKSQQNLSKTQTSVPIIKRQVGSSQSKPATSGSSGKNVQPIKRQAKKQNNKKPPIPKYNPPKPQGDKKKKYSQVYEGPDRNLVEQLQRQLAECPTISFDDIAELEVAKNLLQEAVLLPRLMPQFFQGIRKAMKGILLFGPPGTGKTLLAKAIAKDNIFFNVSASSLASKWKGQSQKMVRILFQMAKYHSPSVIFFDQIDCIGSKRSQNEHESARKVKTQLLVQMDGVGSTQNQVFVLAATNRPWDLDEALRRRLQKRIYIPLPGSEGRKKMFDINLKGLKTSQKINWQKLVDLTKGCSGADICNVCRDAAYMPMRRKINQIGGIAKLQQLKQSQLIDEEVTENDLIQAAKKVKPSVGKDDLKRYEAWMAQFGSS